jgi:anti-sigma B factor antagonist
MSSREADPTLEAGPATVSLTSHPGLDVVSVAGEFDMVYQILVRRLVSDTTKVTQSRVVLDLSRVRFMDAAGAGAIVHCKRVLAERSAELVLVCPEGQVRRVLRLLGFEQVLPIYRDRESALLQGSEALGD